MMRRISACLVLCALAAGAVPAGAALVQDRTSIFNVDGLMADSMEKDLQSTGQYFNAELKRYPLVETAPKRLMPPPVSPVLRASAPPQGKAMEHLRNAEVFVNQQDWALALNEIQQGLEADPNNMVLVRRGAAVAALARKFGVADEYFRRVVEANPVNLPFLVGRAGILFRLLRLDEADALVQRALAIDPKYLTARFNKACIQVARGDTDIDRAAWGSLATEGALQIANWLDADRQDYVSVLGEEGFKTLCDVVLGEGTAAHVPEFISAVKEERTAAAAKKWDEAIAAAKKAQALGAKAMGLEMDISRFVFEKGDVVAARNTLKSLSERYPESSMVMYNYAFILIRLKQYGEAGRLLEKARTLVPKDDQVAFALACVYAATGSVDQVWPLISQVAFSEPDNLREWVQGDEDYLKAIREDPKFKDLLSTADRGSP